MVNVESEDCNGPLGKHNVLPSAGEVISAAAVDLDSAHAAGTLHDSPCKAGSGKVDTVGF